MKETDYTIKNAELMEKFKACCDTIVDDKEYYDFATDGIIDEAMWSEQSTKVLFILKESYDNKKTTSNKYRHWDLREYIKGGICTDDCTSIKDGKCESCFRFTKTYSVVSSWAYGILHNGSSYNDFKKKSRQEKLEYLKKVAVINIKKADGQTKSTANDLSKYIDNADYRRLLKQQIDIIKPDVIICGGIRLLDKLCLDEYKIIESCHPAYPKKSHEAFFNEVISIYKNKISQKQ